MTYWIYPTLCDEYQLLQICAMNSSVCDMLMERWLCNKPVNESPVEKNGLLRDLIRDQETLLHILVKSKISATLLCRSIEGKHYSSPEEVRYWTEIFYMMFLELVVLCLTSQLQLRRCYRCSLWSKCCVISRYHNGGLLLECDEGNMSMIETYYRVRCVQQEVQFPLDVICNSSSVM